MEEMEENNVDHLSPVEDCLKTGCSKLCFARQHFNWCLGHSAPLREEVHGYYNLRLPRCLLFETTKTSLKRLSVRWMYPSVRIAQGMKDLVISLN
jgi:hypothetical protein